MKDGIREIIGKNISGVVVAQNDKSPRIQLFLTFTDGTYFEIWGDNFSCAGGIDRGGAATAAGYAQALGARITASYPDS